jgi:hypothetical protein
MFEKLCNWLRNPQKIVLYILAHRISRILPDILHIKIKYAIKLGKRLNLKNLKTYNEKIQWLKLYDHNPIYPILADKYLVREYVKNAIGEDYLIPLLGVYNSYDEIDFDVLPDKFVLKPNHTSGNVFICKDKSKIDKTSLERIINKWLNRKYFWEHREWSYKDIKPRILCEKYMVDESGTELKDYKYFCFDGIPKSMFVATDRSTDTRFDFYDMEFNHLPFMQHYQNSDHLITKPSKFNEMMHVSSLLSKDIPHVRIDLYEVFGRIYFGEFTFYHFSGYEIFEPSEYDEMFGSWLTLPQLARRKR